MQQLSTPTYKTNHQSFSDSHIACTDHAIVRMKQRGIKPAWINLLLEYGCYAYQNSQKTYSIYLNKSSIKRIKMHFGNLVDLSKLRRVYLIMTSDSVLVTCAYR